jgi:hypothetical protein
MIVTSGGFNVGTSGGAGTFAASAWINIENNASIKTVLNKRTQNGGWPCIDMAVGTTGQVICNYSTTSYGQCLETYTTAGGLIDPGKWYNIVFVKPAGDYQGVKIYIDGVDTGWTNTLYGSHTYSTTVATSTQPMYLGRFLDGNNSTGNWVNPWVGQLGPIQVYTEALTSAQVKQNFAAQANRFQTDYSIIKSDLARWLDFGNPACYSGGAIGVGSGVSSVSDLKTGTEYGIVNTAGGITYSSEGGGCFDFAGTTNDGIPITGTGAMADCTLSVWVYNISGGDVRQTLLGHYWELNYDRLQLYSYGFSNLGWRFSASGSVPYNTWTNAVMTWDGNNVKAYINGALNYTNTVGAGGTVQNLYEISVSWARLKAKLATCLVYGRALSAVELKHNFDVQRDRFGV